MIYTVTFNPAIDYVVYTDNIEQGKTNRTNSEEYHIGGKGINITTVLNNLGVDSIALGFVGGFTGDCIEKGLKDKNIKTDFVHLKNGTTRINVKIKNTTETEINGQGPYISNLELKQLFGKLSLLNENDTVILAGSVPDSVDYDVYENIIAELSPKGVRCIVDACGKLLTNTLKHKPFLIKPNKQELCELFNLNDVTADDAIKCGKELKSKGAQNVLISLGCDGAYLIDEYDNVHHSKNFEGKVKSTVGSGDSMVAGFVAGYLNKNDYEFALKIGTICGNATAMEDGLATLNKVKELYNK